MPLLWVVLAGLVVGSLGSSRCTSDIDCSLNGMCDKDSGSCKCDAGWTHSDCSRLHLGPTMFTACGQGCAYHGYAGKNTTSWGGSVLKGEDGRFYMMAAEMSKGCGLGQWTTNSQVAATVSSHPLGEYVKYDTPVLPWAHNPEWVRAKDGTYLIYTLGDGVPGPHGKEKDCGGADVADTSGDAVFAGGRRQLEDGNMTFTIHHSASVNGPWVAHIATITGFLANDNMDNWNPAPVVMGDGRIRMMVHTDPEPWAGEIIVEAADWRGPYVVIQKDIPSMTIPKTNEDPFMWQNKRGHWHVLVHRMFDPAGTSPVPSPGWSGGHAFSLDGLHWSNITRCFNTTVTMTDGTSWEAKRRERPKLIFDLDGAPAYLSNGVITANEGTYTLMVPVLGVGPVLGDKPLDSLMQVVI